MKAFFILFLFLIPLAQASGVGISYSSLEWQDLAPKKLIIMNPSPDKIDFRIISDNDSFEFSENDGAIEGNHSKAIYAHPKVLKDSDPLIRVSVKDSGFQSPSAIVRAKIRKPEVSPLTGAFAGIASVSAWGAAAIFTIVVLFLFFRLRKN